MRPEAGRTAIREETLARRPISSASARSDLKMCCLLRLSLSAGSGLVRGRCAFARSICKGYANAMGVRATITERGKRISLIFLSSSYIWGKCLLLTSFVSGKKRACSSSRATPTGIGNGNRMDPSGQKGSILRRDTAAMGNSFFFLFFLRERERFKDTYQETRQGDKKETKTP